MVEQVAVYIQDQEEHVALTVVEVIEQVSVYVGEVVAGSGGGQISKLYYTYSGDEANIIGIPGIGAALWSQVTVGDTPLKQVTEAPGAGEYQIVGNNVIFGFDLVPGENLLFEWQ